MSNHDSMSNDQVRTQIKEIRDLGNKYGRLVEARTLSFPIVAEIIRYYEEDGENEALLAADEKVKAANKKLSQAQGAAGGLTRRINKLEKDLEEMENVKRNNARLSRATSYAHEFVEFLLKDTNVQLDIQGEKLTDNPLFIRLHQELS